MYWIAMGIAGASLITSVTILYVVLKVLANTHRSEELQLLPKVLNCPYPKKLLKGQQMRSACRPPSNGFTQEVFVQPAPHLVHGNSVWTQYPRH